MEESEVIILEGKECKDCKIFTSDIEQGALGTVYDILGNPAFKGQKVRIMPDAHQGEGIVIGFTSPMGELVNPDHVGCDIGCTVSAMFFSEPLEEEQYPLFEHRVKAAVPQGMMLQAKRQFDVKDFLKYLRTELQRIYQNSKGLIYLPEFNNEDDLEDWLKDIRMDSATFYKSIGTLGGGEKVASVLVNS